MRVKIIKKFLLIQRRLKAELWELLADIKWNGKSQIFLWCNLKSKPHLNGKEVKRFSLRDANFSSVWNAVDTKVFGKAKSTSQKWP